jgi:methylenetetrahydrofolate dehydrogenase (NADP+) / methenyltetrahydrofolate cyclohydrolase
VCHSRTKDLPVECRRADILIAAIGRPAFVTQDFIGPGATVIDVGINRLSESEKSSIFGDAPARGVIGDVHPLDVERSAAAYTPVPGGVGPLTIAMLMVNTITAAEQHLA